MSAILAVPICCMTMRSSRVQHVDHALDARLTERAQAPDVRPADADGRRAERQRLEDVRAAADAAVDEHRDATADGLDDLGQAVDRAAQRFVGTAAVVADDDAVRAVLEAERRVLARLRCP